MWTRDCLTQKCLCVFGIFIIWLRGVLVAAHGISAGLRGQRQVLLVVARGLQSSSSAVAVQCLSCPVACGGSVIEEPTCQCGRLGLDPCW